MKRSMYVGELSKEGIAEYERLHHNLPEVILRSIVTQFMTVVEKASIVNN